MTFIINLINWNVLTQFALIACYFIYRDWVTTAYLIHYYQPGYFYFLVAGVICLVWLVWTLVTDVLGIRRLGPGVDRYQASK